MKSFFLIALILVTLQTNGQDSLYNEKEVSVSQWVDGTLLIPNNIEKPDLAIIIAGSGPTNRNGNQNFMKNNTLKKLAIALGKNGIASFRYDKRIVKQIRQGRLDNNITFDDFVADAKDVVAHFYSKENFNKIIVIGHSQGSLVGILASNESVDGFVSLAGAGQNIGDVIIDQVTKTAPMFTDDTNRIVETLRNGSTTSDYPQALSSLFSVDLQPFMINWMKYSPSEEIKKLQIPVLIINGTKDLQVSVNEAKLLAEANPKSQLTIIDNMNHVLFEIKGDDLENSKSYNEAYRPISKTLVQTISEFIKSL